MPNMILYMLAGTNDFLTILEFLVFAYFYVTLIYKKIKSITSESPKYYVDPENVFDHKSKEAQKALLIVLAIQIKADGRVMPAETEKTKAILEEEFPPEIASKLFSQLEMMVKSEEDLDELFAINIIRKQISYRLRLTILQILCKIVKSDGIVTLGEVTTIRDIARKMGIRESVIDYHVNRLQINGYDERAQRTESESQSTVNSTPYGLNGAYATLGISPDASNSELKTAFRKCAMNFHPDRFATASADAQKEAEAKFKEIVAAYERIKRARGL